MPAEESSEELVGKIGCECQRPDDPETAFSRAGVVSDAEDSSYGPVASKQ
jgi:hypothetical protein